MRSNFARIYRKTRKRVNSLIVKSFNTFYVPHPNPVFVLGNEKSGTTIIAASLAEATQKTVTLDIEGLWDPIQTKLFRKEIDIRKVIDKNARAFSKEIVKEPVLTFEIEQLMELYPDSQYVLVIRDPRDNIRSILNRLAIPGNLKEFTSTHIDGLGDLWTTWNTVIDNTWLGLQTEHYIGSLAMRWNHITGLYLKNKESIHLIKYEDFQVDKVEAIHSLVKQLNLIVQHDISNFVHQQFQPKGDREVNWSSFFGDKNLSLINKTCSNRMEILGYKI